MNRTYESIRSALVVMGVVLALLFVVSGCGDEEPTPQQPMTEPPMSEPMGEGGGMGEGGEMGEMDMPTNTDAAVLAGIEQKTCPVMEGNPINPEIFVEYQGKKVYFCCEACPATFLANPEQYLAKLPQFQE